MKLLIRRLFLLSMCGGLAVACGAEEAPTGGADAGTTSDASEATDGGDSFPVILQLTDTERDFEGVPVQTSRELRFNAVNASEGTIEATDMSIVLAPGSDPAFEIFYLASRYARSNPITVRVVFSPTELRAYTGEVIVQFEGAPSPQTVSLRGQGVASDFEIDPSRVDFGTAFVGASLVRTVRITNATGEDVRYGLTRLMGVDECPSSARFCLELPDRFLDPDDRFQLSAGSTRQFDVRFNASNVNNDSISGIELLKVGESEPILVAFEGRSRDTVLDCRGPGRLDSPVSVCAPAPIECTAWTNLAATVRDWDRGPDTGPEWTIPSGRRVELASGERFTIDVEFCPGRRGQSNGSVEVEFDNDGQVAVETVVLVGLGGF